MPKISSRPTFTHPVGYQKSDQPSGGNKKKLSLALADKSPKSPNAVVILPYSKGHVTAAV